MKVLIIGGVAAGTKTAAKIKREMGDNCSVTILNVELKLHLLIEMQNK